jgi:hypothetical protein
MMLPDKQSNNMVNHFSETVTSATSNYRKHRQEELAESLRFEYQSPLNHDVNILKLTNISQRVTGLMSSDPTSRSRLGHVPLHPAVMMEYYLSLSTTEKPVSR